MFFALFLLLLTQYLAPGSAKVFTGFNYGAFWSDQNNHKQKDDFVAGFKLAQSLDTPVLFDSARLFTCIQAGTTNDPSSAFDAAIETNTNLLLGMWASPNAAGAPNDEQLSNELTALAKGFQKHGQKLADLVIGLSVGNEDVFRFSTGQTGLAADTLSGNIEHVKQQISASEFGKYMQGKPVGHVDTAQHAVVKGADFVGMTAYPYWNNETIENGKKSFDGSLSMVKGNAGNTEVWVAEVGWPFAGPQRGEATAGPEAMQKYWKEVGCSLFGKYNTFWYELIMDAPADQPDWGLVDAKSHKLRIQDLSCPGMQKPAGPSPPPAGSNVPTNPPGPSTLVTVPSPPPPAKNTPLPVSSKRKTIQVIETVYLTAIPAPSAPANAPPASPPSGNPANAPSPLPVNPSPASPPPVNPLPSNQVPPPAVPQPQAPKTTSVTVTNCVTVADVSGNGTYASINVGPAAANGQCTPPAPYTQSFYPGDTVEIKTIMGSSTAIVSPTPGTPVCSIPSMRYPSANTSPAPPPKTLILSVLPTNPVSTSPPSPPNTPVPIQPSIVPGTSPASNPTPPTPATPPTSPSVSGNSPAQGAPQPPAASGGMGTGFQYPGNRGP